MSAPSRISAPLAAIRAFARPIERRTPAEFGLQAMICAAWLAEGSPAYMQGGWVSMLNTVARAAAGESRTLIFDIPFRFPSRTVTYRIAAFDRRAPGRPLDFETFIGMIGSKAPQAYPKAEIGRASFADVRRIARSFAEPHLDPGVVGEAFAPLARSISAASGEVAALMVCGAISGAMLQLNQDRVEGAELANDTPERTDVGIVGIVRRDGSSAVDARLPKADG